MKLRWWPHTSDARIASTRLRCLRIVQALRAQQLDAGLWAPGDPPPDVLVLAKRYDKESMAAAGKLRSSGTRLVLDLCDNHFFCEPPTAAWTRRAETLRDAVARVDAVTVATSTLGKVVLDECPAAPTIHVIGDAVEPPAATERPAWVRHPFDTWALAQLRRRIAALHGAGGVALLWFGNHGSDNAEGGMRDLLRLVVPLRALCARQPATLTVISNQRSSYEALAGELPLACTYLPWRAHDFSAAAALHDIAVLPISPNPFTACKSNNRVATALMHGLAVAADPVPSYLDFIDCIVMDDWHGGLQMLASDAIHRRAMATFGRTRAETRWNLAAVAAQWRSALAAVASAPAWQGACVAA